MNCPKCGSPINPGDRFCQVCGSTLEEANTQPQQTVPVQTENVQPAPMPQPATQPMPTQQPMPAPMPAPAPVAAPTEAKKGNKLVIILVAVIAVLVVAIVAILFLGNGDKNESSGGKNGGSVVAKNDPQYKEASVGKYKFKLMDGYNATMESAAVYLYNDSQSVIGTVESMENVSITDIDALSAVAKFAESGFECTYKDSNVEGKKALIFTGKYLGTDLEVIYVQISPTVVVGGEVQYRTGTDLTNEAEKVHKMYAMITTSDKSTNLATSSTNFFDTGLNK